MRGGPGSCQGDGESSNHSFKLPDGERQASYPAVWRGKYRVKDSLDLFFPKNGGEAFSAKDRDQQAGQR